MATTNSTPPAKEVALSLLTEALNCGIRGANKTAILTLLPLLATTAKTAFLT